MKYYSSLLEKLLFDGYFLSQRILAGITTACYIKSIAPVRVNEKKSELVMADRWYRCCFTKAYFMHTVSEISLVNQSRKRDRKSLDLDANCFIDRPCRKVERGIWKYSSVVRAKEGERIDAFSMADRLERKFIRDSLSFNTFGQPAYIYPRFRFPARVVLTDIRFRVARPHLLRKYSRRSFNTWPKPTMPGSPVETDALSGARNCHVIPLVFCIRQHLRRLSLLFFLILSRKYSIIHFNRRLVRILSIYHGMIFLQYILRHFADYRI